MSVIVYRTKRFSLSRLVKENSPNLLSLSFCPSYLVLGVERVEERRTHKVGRDRLQGTCPQRKQIVPLLVATDCLQLM